MHYDTLLLLNPNRPVPTAKEIKDAYGAELGPSEVSEAIGTHRVGGEFLKITPP